MLGSDVKSALKNEDIISIVYLTKDNERQQCNAFKFLASNSVLGSGNAKNETLVKFFSDDSVEMMSDVKIKRTHKKRKQDSTK